MGKERFRSFTVSYLDTDLWIGVNASSECCISEMHDFVLNEIQKIRSILELHIDTNKDFGDSLVPIQTQAKAPLICQEMIEAGCRANVGPMAAVAGAFAHVVGKQLKKSFSLKEVAVENGGDIYLDIEEDLVMSIFAGKSPLSEKVGIRIPKGIGELGVCTSAGTVGHSLSFGKADAVVIACKNTALADAYATGFANKVQSSKDIELVLDLIEKEEEILSAVIICEGMLGIRGDFDLIPLNK